MIIAKQLSLLGIEIFQQLKQYLLNFFNEDFFCDIFVHGNHCLSKLDDIGRFFLMQPDGPRPQDGSHLAVLYHPVAYSFSIRFLKSLALN